MNRSDRQNLVSQLVTDGDPVEDIITQVSTEAGCQPDTVRKDIAELFPALADDQAAAKVGTLGPDTGDDGDDTEADEALAVANAEIERLKAQLAAVPPAAPQTTAPPTIDEALAVANRELATTKEDDEYAHLTVMQIAFDANDGSLLSKPFAHTVNRREWGKFINGHRDNGVTVLSVDKMPTGLKAFNPDTFYKQFKNKQGVATEDIARTRAIKELGL